MQSPGAKGQFMIRSSGCSGSETTLDGILARLSFY